MSRGNTQEPEKIGPQSRKIALIGLRAKRDISRGASAKGWDNLGKKTEKSAKHWGTSLKNTNPVQSN